MFIPPGWLIEFPQWFCLQCNNDAKLTLADFLLEEQQKKDIRWGEVSSIAGEVSIPLQLCIYLLQRQAKVNINSGRRSTILPEQLIFLIKVLTLLELPPKLLYQRNVTLRYHCRCDTRIVLIVIGFYDDDPYHYLFLMQKAINDSLMGVLFPPNTFFSNLTRSLNRKWASYRS